MKCEVFIGIIRDKYVDRCLSFDLVNGINYVNVWILSLWSTVICEEEYAICVLIMGPFILIGMTPLCLGGILRVDLTGPIVAMQSQECV